MSTTVAPAPVKATAKDTITAVMSKWAADLKFEDLSQDAIYQAKRFFLDSIGCALGGYQQHDVAIALGVLDEIAGSGKATVIGTGKQVDAVSASLANALMIRCMDYNDIYWKQDPSHPSDIFPAAMACCERAGGDAASHAYDDRTPNTMDHRVPEQPPSTPHPSPNDEPYLCLPAKASGDTTLPWPPFYTNGKSLH